MHNGLYILSLLFALNAASQTRTIDSLMKVLPTLTHGKKVDCLNAIAWEYNFDCIHTDSSLKYANLSFKLATGIRSNAGKAVSLLIQGDVHGRLLGNLVTMERNCKLAIELLQDEKDPAHLSIAYYKLAIALNSQGKMAAALDAASRGKQIATIANDKSGLGWTIKAMGLIYFNKGEFWKSFQYMIESQRIGKELNDSLLTAVSLAFIARSFNRVGDPQKAINYYHQSLRYATPFLLLCPHLEDMAFAQLQLKQYDSVIYYHQKHRDNLHSLTSDVLVKKRFNTLFWGYSVEVQLAKGEYEQLISTIVPQLQHLRQQRDVIPLMQSLLVIGKVYHHKVDDNTALKFTRELYQTARRTFNKQYIREANRLMALHFDSLYQADSAYFYFKNYTAIKEAMDTTQFAQRTALYIAASETESNIILLKKDKTINEQQLVLKKKELLKQNQLKNLLAFGFVVLLLLSVFVMRNIILKRKNEKLLSEQLQLTMKRKALELEMQALRAQMNPHFIFNCLSAIDNLIQTSQPDKATSYLARFANLIRGVLDSSKNNVISFQKDFETLKLYLEMEQFRCNNKFVYSLDADQELLNGDYKVPPLIIQPFVENAIHHGLLNKADANRYLQVTAHLKNEHIIYCVTDNGVGRKRAAFLREKNRPGHQSYGIAITRERIQLHNRNSMINDVLITDLDSEGIGTGTIAVVKINNLEL